MAVELTEPESKFVKIYIRNMNAAEAWRKAFPEKCKVPDGKLESEKGNKFLKVPRIAEAVDRHSQSSEELAIDTLRSTLLAGKMDTNSIRAAEYIMKYRDTNSIKSATDKWAQCLCSINARVIIPEAELDKRANDNRTGT